jgi:hypothetical protein
MRGWPRLCASQSRLGRLSWAQRSCGGVGELLMRAKQGIVSVILAAALKVLICSSTSGAAEGDQRTFVAHVSSHRTQQEALSAYGQLKGQLPAALQAVKPFVQEVDLGSKGKWHRLRLGPLMTRDEAAELCKSLENIGHRFCEPRDAYELAQRAPGHYGELILKPLNDGQNMMVVKPFGFVDSQARTWETGNGSITDGASIPRVFWSLVGSPYTGKYLRAAVIHDYYVKTKYRSWSLTHDVFYEAMIASGVDKQLALLMWAAVHRFGPRWAESESYCAESCAGGDIVLDNVELFPVYIDHEFKKIKELIEGNPSITKEAVGNFISEETYYPPGTQYKDSSSEPYPARIRGYVSGGFFEEKEPNLKGQDWYNGPGTRRFVDGLATTRWPAYGSGGGNCSDNCYVSYRVTRVRSPDKLRVRAGPSVKYEVIAELADDARGITIEKRCKSMWCRIKYGAIEGYVDTGFLDFNSYERSK